MIDLNSLEPQTFADETQTVTSLISEINWTTGERGEIQQLAHSLVGDIRKKSNAAGSIDSFLQEYSLSSDEGVVLMCLAEALLRIPDAATADKFIADKLAGRDWESHLSKDNTILINASAWSLMLTGRILENRNHSQGLQSTVQAVLRRAGEPIIRNALKQAMRIMARQFVFGRTIEEATQNAGSAGLYSFDMLGEGAMTMADADRYLAAYRHAIKHIADMDRSTDVLARSSLSIKLSALHPRYDYQAATRVKTELLGRVVELVKVARSLNVGVTIDAEEQSRLALSLELFATVAHDPAMAGWNGLGLAVQAYGKRARGVIDWLGQLASSTSRRIPVRLVKGAYWDTEIKRAQEGGFEGYPVFTRKSATDTSYLACARRMLASPHAFYPQFATHNAHTVAAIVTMARGSQDHEFQRLHGMGQELYSCYAKRADAVACRVYAPVGGHEDLLSYLVRRLLENGANTSFVNRLADDELPISTITVDPVALAGESLVLPNPIALPVNLFTGRTNSSGQALWLDGARSTYAAGVVTKAEASSIVGGTRTKAGKPRVVSSPNDRRIILGTAYDARTEDVIETVRVAVASQSAWDLIGAGKRADIMDATAHAFEGNATAFAALLVHEAGKTLEAAQSEIREAVDFLRYYAMQARAQFSNPVVMEGPTGERNELSAHGRGVFACISPWNFPLAIFTGQIAAALVCGNAVIAKPAEQTPLVASMAVGLMHKAGVPVGVLNLLLGDGADIGKILLALDGVAGVAFTGSNATAASINRALAAHSGPIATLIAETGGMNAMIVDSSALPEQAVRDLVASAFDSAGQRCSAARVAFIQKDVFKRMETMLCGAMRELAIGSTAITETDIGPVIDDEALAKLNAHKQLMKQKGRLVFECGMPATCGHGTFVAPTVYEVPSIDMLQEEVFGPILHLVAFEGSELDDVCAAINKTGFGLTLGLHTRMESVAAQVRQRCQVGNLYVNRNQIGAVVGSQPFGGERLSGTGPKAGGPHYLNRFVTERVCSTDTTASGGNAALLAAQST